MKRSYLFVILLISLSPTYAQQDPLYNQYQFNQLMINPAYAGVYEHLSLNLISRVQWAGIEGAPLTNTLTGNTSLLKGRIGTGFSVIYDRFGVNENIEAQAIYSYIINMGFHKLSMGVQGGLINYKYNYLDLNLEYIDDPDFIPTNENFTKPNYGAGIMLLGEKYYLGVSVPRILNIELKDDSTTSTRYRRHYYFSGGYVFLLNQTALKFTGLVRYVENNPMSVEITGSVLMGETIWAGVMLRNLNGVGLFGVFQFSDILRVGYSFELPTTELVRSNFGTHEITIGVDLDVFKNQLSTRRYF